MTALGRRLPRLPTCSGLRKWAICAAAAAFAATLLLPPALGHPIVSTDINRHVLITVHPRQVEVDYLYEMLEIAAIAAAREADTDHDGTTSETEAQAQFDGWVDDLTAHLDLELDGVALALTPIGRARSRTDGPFGLFTTHWDVRFRASLPARGARGSLVFRDRYRQDQVGWKEIVIQSADGVRVSGAGASASDRSKRLTDYAAIAELPNPNETAAMAMLGSAVAAPPTASAGSAAKTAAARRTDGAPAPRRPKVPSNLDTKIPRAPASTTPVPPAARAAPAAHTWSGRIRQDGWPFFRLGVQHIATGYDHLLFLLGLLLFQQSLGRVAAVITAFTVAHSLTLALAALGWVSPPGALIDILIPVTIAYVGAVTLVRPGSRHGPLLAFGFGLIHGFGFAGALNAALGDRIGSQWLLSLFGFNLGIEAFQLLAVCSAYPLLCYTDRYPWSASMRRGLSLLVMGAGLAWLLNRFELIR